jgi:hypothetical protein
MQDINRLAEIEQLDRQIAQLHEQKRALLNGGVSSNRDEKAPSRRRNPWREVDLICFEEIAPRLDRRWLVQRLIQPEQITVVFGPPGCGKTFFALDIGLHVAAGVDWCGRHVASGWVVYIAAEAGRGIENRVAASSPCNLPQSPTRSTCVMTALGTLIGSSRGSASWWAMTR